jgi:beta-glucanase (GH16 family)
MTRFTCFSLVFSLGSCLACSGVSGDQNDASQGGSAANSPGASGAAGDGSGALDGLPGAGNGAAGASLGGAGSVGDPAAGGAAGSAGPTGSIGDATSPDPMGSGGAAGDLGAGGSSGAVGVGGNAGSDAAAGSAGTGGGLIDPDDIDEIHGHPDPDGQYPAYDGFTPYLFEEFNEPLDLDNDPYWTWGDGALFEGMTRMVEDNLSFADGKLVIRVTDEEQPGAYSFSAADNVATKPLSSGELRTIYNNFRYGRYEVRMKAAAGASNYIHTMFAYRTPAYLKWREIDIEIQASPTNSFISNIITAPAGQRFWSSSIEDATTSYPYGGEGSSIPDGFSTTDGFHTYAFEWLPTSIKWFVDGTLIRVKNDGVGKNNLKVPTDSAKIVMNMWVFTNANLGGGDPADNSYPITGYYDWFHFYKWNGDDTYPCDGTPSCLPADDLVLAKNNINDPLPDIRPELCTGEEGDIDAPCGQ